LTVGQANRLWQFIRCGIGCEVDLGSTKTATIAAMDVWLERLETKTATEFRYLRWGLGIVIALVLGLVTKVILDWLDSPILSLFGRAINAIHF
jgi:hypothetical protein